MFRMRNRKLAMARASRCKPWYRSPPVPRRFVIRFVGDAAIGRIRRHRPSVARNSYVNKKLQGHPHAPWTPPFALTFRFNQTKS